MQQTEQRKLCILQLLMQNHASTNILVVGCVDLAIILIADRADAGLWFTS